MTEEIQEQISSLKLEIDRLNNVINIDHIKLIQLNLKFMAHRDRADIHKR